MRAHRNGISRAELQERLGCGRNALDHALNFLEYSLQAPLVRCRRTGYRYDGDGIFELPGMWFSSEELATLLVVDDLLQQRPLGLLSEKLRSLKPRLKRLLGTAQPLDTWDGRLRLVRSAVRSEGMFFGVVAGAAMRRQRLMLQYHARSNDRMFPREVSPQRLTLYRDNWYVEAWCHARDDLRVFSIDRIIHAEALDLPAQEIAVAALDDFAATGYGIFTGPADSVAELRFTPHIARWVAAEQWHPQQVDCRDADGGLIRRIPYRHDIELLMDVFRYGPDVEVLGPEHLREAAIRRVEETVAVYRVADVKHTVVESGLEMTPGLNHEGAQPAPMPEAGHNVPETASVRRRI